MVQWRTIDGQDILLYIFKTNKQTKWQIIFQVPTMGNIHIYCILLRNKIRANYKLVILKSENGISDVKTSIFLLLKIVKILQNYLYRATNIFKRKMLKMHWNKAPVSTTTIKNQSYFKMHSSHSGPSSQVHAENTLDLPLENCAFIFSFMY